MPRLRLNRQPQEVRGVSPAMPDVGEQTAGARGAVQLAGAIADVGLAVEAAAVKRRAETAKTALIDRLSTLKQDAFQQADPLEIGAVWAQGNDNMVGSVLEGEASDQVREEVQAFYDRQRAHMDADIQGAQWQRETQIGRAATLEKVSALRRSMVAAGASQNEELKAEILDTWSDAADAMLYTREEATKNSRHSLDGADYSSGEREAFNDPHAVLEKLDDQGYLPDITPEHRESLRKIARAYANSLDADGGRANTRVANRLIEDATRRAERTGENTVDLETSLRATNVDEELIRQGLVKVKSRLNAYTALKQAQAMNPNGFGDLLDDLKPDYKKPYAAIHDDTRNFVASQLQEIIKSRNDDPAGAADAAIAGSPKSERTVVRKAGGAPNEASADERLAWQEQMGVAPEAQRVLSNEDVRSYKERWTNGSPDQIIGLAAEITGPRAFGMPDGSIGAAPDGVWGRHTGRGIEELLDAGMPGEILMIADAARRPGGAVIARSLAENAVLSLTEARTGLADEDVAKVNSEISVAWPEIFRSMPPDEKHRGAVRQVLLKYGYQTAKNAGQGGEGAVNDLFKDHYEFSQFNNGSLRISKAYGADGIRRIAELGRQILGDALKYKPLIDPGFDRADDYRVMIQNHGTWITNEDETGARLYLMDPEGRGMADVVDVNGNPITFSFSDASRIVFPEERKPVEDKKRPRSASGIPSLPGARIHPGLR